MVAPQAPSFSSMRRRAVMVLDRVRSARTSVIDRGKPDANFRQSRAALMVPQVMRR